MKKFRNICIVIVVAILGYYIANIYTIWTYNPEPNDKSADVAIVLGAGASDAGVCEVYAQRLHQAARLYKNRQVKAIITTGGTGEGNTRSDADVAKSYLIACGIPEEAILLEDKSTITRENLEYSVPVMKEHGLDTALVISDPLHMKRAMLMAEDVGLDCQPSPTYSTAYKTLKTKIPFVLRETFFYIGYKWYRIFI